MNSGGVASLGAMVVDSFVIYSSGL